MCVRSVRPFSNRSRRFLPRALTSSIRSPTGPRPRRSLLNRVTRAPTNALRKVVAARKIVSPSGIFFFQRLRRLRRRGLAQKRRPLQVALDPRRETSLLQRGRERRRVHVLTVHARDQERLAPAPVHLVRQRPRQRARRTRPLRLLLRQERLQILL